MRRFSTRVVARTADVLWDATSEEVRPARTKEGSHDHPYFPDRISAAGRTIDGSIAAVDELPELPAATGAFTRTYPTVTSVRHRRPDVEPGVGDYFEQVARGRAIAKAAANWVMGEVLARAQDVWSDDRRTSRSSGRSCRVAGSRPRRHGQPHRGEADLRRDGRDGEPPAQIAEREGLLKVGDDDALARWIDEVFAEHPDEADDSLRGERQLQGVLVGFVMKKSKRRRDPKRVNQLLATRVGS